MQNPVSPTKPGTLASPQERARAVQAVLDKDGPEMDRRRELTQEVVDALAGQDLLRMLLPKSMGGQEVLVASLAVLALLCAPLLLLARGTRRTSRDRKSTRLNSSHRLTSRMPSSA